MRKKISTDQLQLGVYIDELCGSWMDHPFWRASFLLKDPIDLKRLRASAVREVWIDTQKGRDIEAGESEAEVARQVEEKFEQIEVPTTVTKCSFESELQRAESICTTSKQAVTRMFQEVRMGKAVGIGQVEEVTQMISRSVDANRDALISLARLKSVNEYTYMHSVAVCALMIALARELGLDDDQVQQAGIAGLLHDLGKAKVPNRVLNKKGKLTESEFKLIKDHPIKGWEILQSVDELSDEVRDVCLHHHEKIDGSGYPDGLDSESISLFAKMGAVCDVYDAITSNRPYKPGWDPAISMSKMAEWSSNHFDEFIFQSFVKSIGIYPTGSLVRLESEHLAVVVEQNPESLLNPIVKIFFSIRSNSRITPRVLNLGRRSGADRIISREHPESWGLQQLDSLWRNTS